MGVVGLGGLEPPASPLSGVRSNQLSYRPGEPPAAVRKFAPQTRAPGGARREFASQTRRWPRPGTVPGAQRSRRERQTIRVSARPGHRAWIGSSGSALYRTPRGADFRTPRGAEGEQPTPIFKVKEVIQPQVPLRLPCYDLVPVMNHTVVTVLPKVRLATSGATHSHDLTGGVYKARERIHRDVLIRDY